MSELRKDIIMDHWVIIDTETSRHSVVFGESIINKNNIIECPLCPGKENLTLSEILAYRPDNSKKNTPGWIKRIIPNSIPSVRIEGEFKKSGIGMYDMMTGIGAHEIIIETPHHDLDIQDQDLKTIENTIWAYRDRIIDLKNDRRLKYILIFKNRGFVAGATMDHPHSQLIATPIIPKRIDEELSNALRYYKYKERCVFCDIIQQELQYKERIIIENPLFISFSPFASISPFESWILPLKHNSNFEDISANEVIELAKILKDTLRRISIALNKPAYNYILHTAPANAHGMEYYHWHIEIIPKMAKLTSFEWDTGLYVNPTSPEDSSRYLRSI
ncbi:DUF4921 family protein [Candidatus Desantisbacteria bacterium]|nr:DUF4921 family protein [Candidatus Desantisbacteria bacterium]